MNLDTSSERRGATLAALRAFVAVVESGSFSNAAHRLGLTQPSVSAQLANLEEACGVRLLHRRGGIGLTADGQDLLRHARLVLARMEAFDRAVSDLSLLQRGRLTVGLSTPTQAMPLLARFAACHPGIELATRLGNTQLLLAELADCRLDVAVLTLHGDGPPLPSHLQAVLLTRQRLGLCLGVNDPWVARRAIRFSELAGSRIILREPGSMTRALFEEAAGRAGVRWSVGLEVGSQDALREAVAAGLGRGMLLRGEVGVDPRLAFRPLREPEATGATVVVALSELAEAPSVAAFLALATQPRVAGTRRQRAT